MDPSSRAQSVQIGALLLFAFLVIGLSAAQAFVVPEENAEVEFNHNQELQDDMVDLRSNLLRSAVTGERRTSTVDLGTGYPARTFLVNPGPASGTLRTEPAGTIRLDNAAATDDEVADYLDGSARTFPTRAVAYEPSYNEYRSAPATRVQASVLSNVYDGGTRVQTNQTLVSGRVVTLVPVVGDLGATGTDSRSVQPRVISQVNRTVTVEAAGGPITLQVETELSEAAWERLLRGELDPGSGDNAADRYVRSFSCTGTDPCGTLTLTLERGTRYELRMGEVGVGSIPSSATDDHDPEYVVPVGGDGAAVTEGRTRTVTFEVRDEFNNPVSGARVVVTQPGVGSVTNGSRADRDGNVTAVTGANGQVTVTYRAPTNVREDAETTLSATVVGQGVPETGGPLDERPETSVVSLTAEDGGEGVENTAWPHPLVDAVEPDATDSEFVRVYFPSGVGTPAEWALTDGEASTQLPSDADGFSGEHYFATNPTTFAANHPVDPSRVHALGAISFENSDSIRLVHRGRTVDAFGYEGETVDGRYTSAGWSLDFAGGVPVNTVVERATEDGAYADLNGTADWGTVPESAFFERGEPTAASLSASSNYAGRTGPGNSGGPGSNRVTFTYSFDDDGEIRDVRVNATDGAETVEATADTSADSLTVTFSDTLNMDTRDFTVHVRVRDGEGNTVTYTGRLADAGETITLSGGGLRET